MSVPKRELGNERNMRTFIPGGISFFINTLLEHRREMG